MPPETEYQTVPLARLVESPTNPRRITSKAADAELVASVKQLGVLEPLLVRETAAKLGNLELVAGHRRLAAARAAGLAEVPVRILALDDEQALEAAIVENLQRQDIHPLDEADGFARLLETNKHDVKDIAARVGKSEAYVYQRLALRRLSKKARDLFVKEVLTAAHAMQLVKLTAEQQDEALKWGAMRRDDVATAREFGRYIRNEFFNVLSGAPWKLDDAALLPKAGACAACPKRASAQPGLFTDDAVKGETCLDSKCFSEKMQAFLTRRKEELRAAGEKPIEISTEYYAQTKGLLHAGQFTKIGTKNACESARKALVVEGNDRGQTITVCADSKCKDHGRGRYSEGGDPTWKKKQAAETKKRKTEKACRAATAELVLAKLAGKPLPNAVRHALVAALFHQFTTIEQTRSLAAYGVETPKGAYGTAFEKLLPKVTSGMDAAALDLFLVRLVASTDFFGYGATDHVKALAAAAGVKPVTARDLQSPAKKKPAAKPAKESKKTKAA